MPPGMNFGYKIALIIQQPDSSALLVSAIIAEWSSRAH
jgi:hypothetical protein